MLIVSAKNIKEVASLSRYVVERSVLRENDEFLRSLTCVFLVGYLFAWSRYAVRNLRRGKRTI